MATIKSDSLVPSIFNEIIRKRVSDYLDKELKEMIKTKVGAIITDVLSDIQVNSQLYQDMLHYEARLVIKAIYNDKDVEVKETNQ